MKAWRFYNFNDMRLDEIPVPVSRPEHVVVRVLCVQPSVTEAQLARGIRTLAYERIRRRLETEAPLQLFGHEFCAEVVEVGEGVSRFKAGDRVAARAKLPCGQCPLCLSQQSTLCRKGPVIGFDLPGCFSEFALLPEIALIRIDERISNSEAACLQSLSDSVAAVETAEIQIGNSVAIFGQGSMGFECMQVLRNCGAGKIITVDVREEACEKSRELGADHSINASIKDPVSTIHELTGGNGADVVFDCAGGSPRQGLSGNRSLIQAIDAVRSGGKIIGVSWFGEPFPVDIDYLRERSLRYLFPDISTLAHLEYTAGLVSSGRGTAKAHDLPRSLRDRCSAPGFRDHEPKRKIPCHQPGPSHVVRERERWRTPVVFPENFEVTDTRLERITPGSAEPTRELAPGVSLLEFASSRLGAVGFSTGIARFERAAGLTVHSHECGKSITVLAGNCEIAVEGRVFDLCPFDSIHVPAGVAHALRNLSDSSVMLAHMAFSSSAVNYIPADDTPTKTASRRAAEAVALRRFSDAEEYELSSKAWFKDLFAKRLGAQGICGGYGRFAPGASLPCHTHLFDESITIVEGTASCLVAGRRYTLSGCDTALVPQGLPHRFLNESDCEMGMVWVYAGDEPERMIVESFRCSGGDSAS